MGQPASKEEDWLWPGRRLEELGHLISEADDRLFHVTGDELHEHARYVSNLLDERRDLIRHIVNRHNPDNSWCTRETPPEAYAGRPGGAGRPKGAVQLRRRTSSSRRQ